MGPERRQTGDPRRHGYLSYSPLFEGLPYESVEDAIEGCQVQYLSTGEVLLDPTRLNKAMYLVLAGHLDVHLGAENSQDTIPIGPGETLGEMSIIDGQPVSAFVSAGEPSQVVIVPEQVFLENFLLIPGFARNLARVLSARMRASNDRVVARLRERLALEHLQKELQIARGIQEGMLPGRGTLFPDRREIDLYGLMVPARDIGGDLYDAFFVSPDHLALAVGDVSGKGIPAALFMARVVAQLRLVAMWETSPATVLTRLNRLLCEHNDSGMFVTLLYFVLDIRTGQFRYSNAGHNPPVIFSGGGWRYQALPKGLVAGIMGDAPFGEMDGCLAPDETLMLYTDGVTEATNPAERLYGEARLLEALGLPGDPSTAALVERVKRSVEIFADGAAQSDDITMLAIRRL